ncbi:MAG: PAS domain-containing protein [Methylococcus sp.]
MVDDARRARTGDQAAISDGSKAVASYQNDPQTLAEYQAEVAALVRLNEASNRLWSIAHLEQGLEEMLNATLVLMGADFGNVQLYDAQRKILAIAVHNGFGPEFLNTFREVSTEDESACGRALRSGELVVIDDIDTDLAYAPFRAIAQATGYRAVVSVPLIGKHNEPLGMISTHFRTPHRPREAELRRLRWYADHAARYIERCRMEEEHHLQMQRFSLASEAAEIGTWYWDLAQQKLEWSARCQDHLRLTPGTAPSLDHFYQVIHPNDRDRVQACVEQSLTGGKEYDTEYRVVGTDGHVRWISAKGRVFLSADGQPSGMGGITQDITERKEIAANLERMRLLLEEGERIAQLGTWEFDVLAQRTTWSIGEYHIYGMDPATPSPDYQSLQRRYFHPDSRDQVAHSFEQAVRHGKPWTMEHRIVREDGSERLIRDLAYPYFNADGKLEKYIGTTLDITELREAETRLRKSLQLLQENEEHLRLATEVAGVGIWHWDLTKDTQKWSPTCRQHMGVPLGETASYSRFLECLHPEDLEHTQAVIQDALLNRKDCITQYRVLRPEGGYRWIRAVGRGFYDESGNLFAMMGITLDVTELEEAIQALKASEQRYRHLSASLEQKVDERTTQLAAASAAKSQFLAHMSHELRTPMNSVLGFAQLLEREPLEASVLAMVRRIRESGSYLLHIINDILDFSKIEAGQLRMDLQEFTLPAVLSRVNHLLRVSAESKGLTLEVKNSTDCGALMGDPPRLEQILINLTGNAIKFTAHGGVTVSARSVATGESITRIRFEVQDSGIGIAPDVISQLFKPFRQGDASITRSFGGTGLGLAISQQLVDLMGGQMGVTSEVGQGSTFWFELPFEQAAKENSGAEPIGTNEIQATGPHLTGLRVLAVDDSRLNLMVVNRALKLEGCTVTLAPDGQQALQILKTQPQAFDVVLMDIQMPIMDGLTATREIRKDAVLSHMPVIALTAGVLSEERQAALDAGVDGFLAKPLNFEALIATLREYVRS